MIHLRRSAAPALALLATAVLLAGCKDSPTDPGPTLELIAASGNGQYGTTGQNLGAPLAALVRRLDTGAPQASVEVEFTVESGDATLSSSYVSTDSDGYARANLRLGSAADTVRVRATVRIQKAATAVFTAYATVRPQITALSASTAGAGDTLEIDGVGFSATPEQNVVLFSGIRGKVLSSTSTVLRVQVPPCLPAREVGVTTQLGSLVSPGVPLTVDRAGPALALGRGEYTDVVESTEIGCVRLPQGDEAYLVEVLVGGTVGAAKYPYMLRGLSAGAVASPPWAGALTAPVRSAAGARPVFAGAWERSLREREARLVESTPAAARPSVRSPGVPTAVPSVGDKRTFKVLNAKSTFDNVNAVARYVSDQAVIYVDDKAPTGGYSDDDLADFAQAFDDYIYPTDTEAFGHPSDLDGNARIAILFTPTVNALTPRGSPGFVGGFFYGLDLLDREGSNHAEVFYAIVPDPNGTYSDPRDKGRILEVVPAVLAHEFQHMIHFNERVLKRGADGTEALWLSEGMAQMAEELVGQAYADAGAYTLAQRYRDGDEDRAARFLADPSAVSLIVATGQGSLAERGGGWLFTLYLWDQDQQGDVLARLTQTTRTGVANVAAVSGRPWETVFADWATALYTDDFGTFPAELTFPRTRLRSRIRTVQGSYPLDPEALPSTDFTETGSLWSASVRHYIVRPSASGGMVLRLGGEGGGNAPPEAALRLRVLRLY